MKCLAKKPEGRYPTAGSLAAELESFLQGPPPVVAAPLAVPAQPARAAQKPGGCTRIFLSIGGVAFALVALVVWLLK